MTIKEILRDNFPSEEDDNLYVGKIFHIGDSYAFISCKDIPFTRIFLHWSALKQDTLKFPELKFGMQVEFKLFNHPTQGARAINARVIE